MHPLAAVRKYTRKTQREFAALARVSEVTIRKIESGALALSARLAERISAATGVDPASISDPSCEIPRMLGTGDAYSEDSYLYWTTASVNNPAGDESTIIEHAEVLKELTEELLFASVVRKRSFQPVLLALCEALADVRKQFGLSNAVAEMRNGKAGPKDPVSYERRKAQTFHVRILGTTKFVDKALPKLPIPEDPLDYSRAEWDIVAAQQVQEDREKLLKKITKLAD